MRALLAGLALALAVPVLAAAAPGIQLVMVEQTGCVWCARWNAEIAPIYPKTSEGVRAPLRRVDKNAPLPDDLKFAHGITFTPTFVLVSDGVEVDRMEGYPGPDFFWPLLDSMLDAHAPAPDTAAASN